MGEADILLHCDRTKEFRARLGLMKKLGYWAAEFDWPSVRSIYAAILRGIETGREDWGFDPREYASDMLTANVSVKQVTGGKDKEVCRPRDFFFCGPFQKGECNLDAPHIASIGVEGGERMVHHVCSSCLLKDGKKLYHRNGGQGCPRARPM